MEKQQKKLIYPLSPHPNGEKNKNLAVAFIPLSDGRYLVNSLSDDTLEKGLVFAESTDTVVEKMTSRIRGNAISSIQTGNDFLCYVAYQGNEDHVTVEVQDYNGKNKYSLDCSAFAIMALPPMQIAILRLVYGKMKFFLFPKMDCFVPNMATNPLQKLLTLKQIISTI